ncbi:MAG: glycosyltransferase [Deltaproteobacteria bacterium]|nr:glycosyltransferase [Deltaproteobacteria bacterium]
MKTWAVTVTYGNRFHLLQQGIESLIREGVSKIIVVDNHSEPLNRTRLKEFEEYLKGKLRVIYLPENTGSAGGFKRGMEEACNDKECEFLWLLDDDNRPRKGALKALTYFWNQLKENRKEETIALMSFREDRGKYKEAVLMGKPDHALGRKNSFLGFHGLDFPGEILRRVGQFSSPGKDRSLSSGQGFGTVSATPYGGMFFHKRLLDHIGYPKPELFLYGDDFEFSYRITEKGGKIFLLLSSVVEDLEKSWHMKKKQKIFETPLVTETDAFRLYYHTRNRVYFEKRHRVTNPMIYFLNQRLLLAMVWVLSLSKGSSNSKILKKAINDANKGKLGTHPIF